MIHFIFDCLALLSFAFVWVTLSRRFYEFEGSSDEVHYLSISPSWRIALSRHRSVTTKPVNMHPVLLVPGLGASRVAYDLGPGASLSRYLATQGFDVWTVELRGRGLSDSATLSGPRRFNWSFDSYLHDEIPAALAQIEKETGSKQVHWIGHSMGGQLLYATLTGKMSTKIRSGVAIGSSLEMSGTSTEFKLLSKLMFLSKIVPAIPLGFIGAVLAPLSARVPNLTDYFNAWVPNMDARLFRILLAHGWGSVPARLFEQMVTTLEAGGLQTEDGSRPYTPLLSGCKIPVLAVAGDKDRQCPPEASERTLAALGNAECRAIVFGKQHGHTSHYGHFDLICGKSAPQETWPEIVAWLKKHDKEE